MTDRKTASTITDDDLTNLYDQLAALRAVARGYCPACGRGDAAPTVADWEQQKQRADELGEDLDEAAATIAERTGEINRLTELAEWQQQRFGRAKAALARIAALADEHPVAIDTALIHAALDQPTPSPDPAATETTDDPELTADEARDLVDELSTDLYRAQDALAYVSEWCDLVDRDQRPITTADVREWLKGDRCTRQRAADTAPRRCRCHQEPS